MSSSSDAAGRRHAPGQPSAPGDDPTTIPHDQAQPANPGFRPMRPTPSHTRPRGHSQNEPEEEPPLEHIDEEERGDDTPPAPSQRTVEAVKQGARIGKQAALFQIRAARKLATLKGVSVVILALTILSLIFSLVKSADQVIGQNEAGLCADGSTGYAVGAGGSSGEVSGLVNYPADSEENRLRNAFQIADWLARTPLKYIGGKPMNREQIGAVLGNFYQESRWNPYVIQGIGENFGPSVVQQYPNSAMRPLCRRGGRAIGILQMDTERCVILVDLADKMGKHWSDLNVQMEFLRREFDDIDGMGSHISPWFTKGKPNYKEFPEPGRSVEFYTTAFNCSYERSGDCPLPYVSGGVSRYIGSRGMDYRLKVNGKRIEYANWFLSKWQTGAGAGGITLGAGEGGACAIRNTMAGNFNERIVQMATLLAYPTTAESYGPPKREYKLVHDIVEPNEKLYRSCDRFVMTVLRSTVDKNVPLGNTRTQKRYFESHPELYQRITNVSAILPGDILVMPTLARTGHIVVFLGSPTENTVAHASIGRRVGGIGPETRFRRNFGPVFAQWTGYRYIGPDNNYIPTPAVMP